MGGDKRGVVVMVVAVLGMVKDCGDGDGTGHGKHATRQSHSVRLLFTALGRGGGRGLHRLRR